MKIWILLLLNCWMSLAYAGPFGDDDLLPADKAFVYQSSVNDGDRITASWDIADGYYMYRDKFTFISTTEGVELGEPVFPPGKIKQDEFFGEIETFRNHVVAEIPVIRKEGAPEKFTFQSKYQGCADIGVCYPPITKNTELVLAEAAASETPFSILKELSALGLGNTFGSGDELLPEDTAFQLDVLVDGTNTLSANWVIAEGYYLYRHRFEFILTPVEGVSLLPAELPEGTHETDEFFGDIQTYRQFVSARLPVQRNYKAETAIQVTVKYQGCADIGVCYPPITKTFDLLLPAISEESITGLENPTTTLSPTEALSEQDDIAHRLAEGNVLATLLTFFGFGLLLSFTPCVFPMIPILSSIIVGQGKNITTRKSFILSLVYVLAMALTYTIAGIFAGLSGDNIQAAFQNPWILSAFSGVFVLLSFSMFGFFELQMPAFLQSKLTAASNRQQGGNLFGVAIMGFLSALIVGPCVAAPLAGALIYIGQTGDPVLGGLALFSLSFGMGIPLIAIGIGAGKLLPKAGTWMDTIKSVFGVMLLGLAIWMLERILPGPITLALWAVLLMVSAIYLRVLEPLPIEATGWAHLRKGIGLVSLTGGILMLIGAASGASDPLNPLERLFAGQGTSQQMNNPQHMVFQPVRSIEELDAQLNAAQLQSKPVLFDFYADWCISCKEMEKYTFGKASVQQALSGVVLLQADVTANSDNDKALLNRFSLFGPPGIIFYDSTGKQRNDLTLVGYKPADDFLEHLQGLK